MVCVLLSAVAFTKSDKDTLFSAPDPSSALAAMKNIFRTFDRVVGSGQIALRSTIDADKSIIS